MEKTCGNCMYAEFADDPELTPECHRYPPVSVVTEYGSSFEFPEVGKFWWCGEWQLK